MVKKGKSSSIFLGILLFALAAFFSISLLSVVFDYGTNSGSLFYIFGSMLKATYGFCSALIPLYLFIAATFCFVENFTPQKASILITSIAAFFTLVIAENTSRKILTQDTSALVYSKLSILIVLTLLLISTEYLLGLIIAGKIAEKKYKELQKADNCDSEEPDDYEELEEDTEDTEDFVENDEEEIPEHKIVDDSIWSLDNEGRKKSLTRRNSSDEDLSDLDNSYIPEQEVDLNPQETTAANESAQQNETITQPQVSTQTETEEKNDSQENIIETAKKVAAVAAPIVTAAVVSQVAAKKIKDESQSAQETTAETQPAQVNPELPAEITESPSNEEITEKYTAENPDDVIDSFERDSIGFDENAKIENQEKLEYEIQFDEENTEEDFTPEINFESDEEETDSEENTVKEINSNRIAASQDEDISLEEMDFNSLTNDLPDEIIAADEVTDEKDVEDYPESEEIGSAEFNDDEIDLNDESDIIITETQENETNESDEVPDSFDESEITDEENDLAESTEEKTDTTNKTIELHSQDYNSPLSALFSRMDADAESDVLENDEFDPLQQTNELPENRAVITDENGNTKPVEVKKPKRKGPYKISTDLLVAYDENPYWIIDEETQNAANTLKETLSEFKIEAEVTGIRKGPVVTMFEILPAPGVKLSKIVALQDNIALRLAASSVRIVAPIPGKRAVGIEVPNQNRAIVSFRECIEQQRSEWKKMAVPVILGKDIQGENQIMDLVKTPHLLIAGSTGAGKSVCVNSMILSILYKRSPSEVKLILIDPKIVELKLYNGIPHLLTPVITEPKRAMQALQYCLCEMERRYAVLDGMGCRDISSYNKKIQEHHIATEKLPYLIIIIDEYADLMATTGKQLESVIARLAAMSRAVGIHLVLATQRPSIDVITGLIKANIPSRIAFMVASKMDSRIIIDQVGADKLLGKGDMLYASSTDPFPVRIQGAFISDQEVEDVVTAVKEWGEPEYIDDEIFVDDEDDEDGSQMSLFSENGDDPLYEKALEIVVQAGKASASYIQRRLKIGYNRAARLVEEMEERGIVGPANGSKPREIIHMP